MKLKVSLVQLPLALGQKQVRNISNVIQTGLTMLRVHKMEIMRFKRKQGVTLLHLVPSNGFSS